MQYKPEANLQMLENLIKEIYPSIKILNKEFFNLSYNFQVEQNGKPVTFAIRRSLVDDKAKQDISAILKERLG